MMIVIADQYAMRYRIRAYTDKIAMLHDKRITDIRFTAELVCDDDLKDLMRYMTDAITALDTHCGYAECDVSDPLDWERGDIWHKAQYVWENKMWKPGKDLARQKHQMSGTTERMIQLYDTDEHTKKIWDMVTSKIHDPNEAADRLISDDVISMIQMTEPVMVSALAMAGMWTCDWVAVSRHIKEVQKNDRDKAVSGKKSNGGDKQPVDDKG